MFVYNTYVMASLACLNLMNVLICCTNQGFNGKLSELYMKEWGSYDSFPFSPHIVSAILHHKLNSKARTSIKKTLCAM